MTALDSVTVIGSIVALMGGLFVVLRFVVGMAVDNLRQEIGGLRSEMRHGFESVDRRLEHLDRDVQKLSEKVFGT